jgi:WD40 repeat protein
MRATVSRFLLPLAAAALSLHPRRAGDPSASTLLPQGGKPVTALVFSWDGRALASGSADRTVGIWQVASNHLVSTAPLHQGKVAALAFAPKGDLIATGGDDHCIRIWELSGAKQLRARQVGRITVGKFWTGANGDNGDTSQRLCGAHGIAPV